MTGTAQVMNHTANMTASTVAVGARAQGALRDRRRTEAAARSRALLLVLAVGLLCFTIVFMSALSAKLNRENMLLREENAEVQADIDNLNRSIGNANRVDKIEEVAISELGMIHSDASQCVTIGQSEESETSEPHLAAEIKKELYS